MEPDLRASESSVLNTTFALDILAELDFSYNKMIIEKSFNYLMGTYDEEKHIWRFIPETTDTSPHAPWWNQAGLEKTFGNFLENPRVKICGYLFHYKELTPQIFRENILKRVLAYMETREDKVSGDTYRSRSVFSHTSLPAWIAPVFRHQDNSVGSICRIAGGSRHRSQTTYSRQPGS